MEYPNFGLFLKKNRMKREVKLTADGSKTLFINDLSEGYHSHHGALQEARHVFIKNGLDRVNDLEINILELGFGTGLNALVSMEKIRASNDIKKINYFTLEKYPVSLEEVKELSFHNLFNFPDIDIINEALHECEWEKSCEVLPNFNITKINTDFYELKNIELPKIDLVYFDCFGARVQPDLWELPLMEMVAEKMKVGGLLTTYSSKGSFQRVLKSLNFKVEKLEGPKGKREMINAWKM